MDKSLERQWADLRPTGPQTKPLDLRRPRQSRHVLDLRKPEEALVISPLDSADAGLPQGVRAERATFFEFLPPATPTYRHTGLDFEDVLHTWRERVSTAAGAIWNRLDAPWRGRRRITTQEQRWVLATLLAMLMAAIIMAVLIRRLVIQ